ncbi:MAG TPA: efflux transporter outer membrane subunit [Usitatibacter sp.]|nr:efflux transporter outer membrane subunit [Usitatibacter sp.]
MSERRALAAMSFAAMLAIAGCAVGPDYRSPPAPSIAGYTAKDPAAVGDESAGGAQSIRAGATVAPRWWESFGSRELDGLVAASLAGSPTLETARATLEEARHQLEAARGSAYPRIDLAASAARANGSPQTGALSAANFFSIGPTASFVPDVFGGTRRRIEQAGALVDFQRAQRQAAELGLAGNTVLQAIALATTLGEVEAVRDVIAVDERNLELVRISASAGKSARLDVLTAESQLASDRALLPPLLKDAAIARDALAVLAGKAPSEWTPPPLGLGAMSLPAELPLALPSQLVRRRPDLVAADAELHAASASIGIATAQLYPSIDLTASWTSSAGTMGALFGSGANTWSLAASLLAPVFDAHTLAAQRDAAIDAYAAQLGTYRQAVLLAFGEVADALQALQQDALLVEAQRKALDTAQATLDLTQQSYQAGQASLLQLLVSQRLYQQARLGDAKASGQRYADSAQLFIVTGGSPLADPAVGVR